VEEALGENQLSASSSQARVEAGAKVDALLRPFVETQGGYVGSVESGLSGRSGQSGSRSSAAMPAQGVHFRQMPAVSLSWRGGVVRRVGEQVKK
jgi:hypothetical protein